MTARRTALAARLLAKAHALPEEDPLRVVAEASPSPRLKNTVGWRTVGREAWSAAGVESPIERSLTHRPPPWTRAEGVTFDLSVGVLRPGASPAEKKRVAERHLSALPQCATWIWTDGSADGGVLNGGAGALVVRPEGDEAEVRVPAGSLCSSFRVEMFALDAALTFLTEHLDEDPGDPVVFCTDSQSALATLSKGPPAQSSPLASAIWLMLRRAGGECTCSGSPLTAGWQETRGPTLWPRRPRCYPRGRCRWTSGRFTARPRERQRRAQSGGGPGDGTAP